MANRLPTPEQDAEELLELNDGLKMATEGLAMSIPILLRRYGRPVQPLAAALKACYLLRGIPPEEVE